MLEKLTLEQLKNLNISELEALAEETRTKIISVVSENGGHLASNLGVVELTIALHKVFDSPKDKIIFDVSHQAYAHKLITGRYDEFSKLRKYKGISGFAKYSESEHDVYEAGHSSTAISAGLGFLEAKTTFPDKIGEVVAIVGDASIANGLSFEALNYLGSKRNQKMIIIINDNEMGISKNVGSLAKSFNKIRAKGSFKVLRKITPFLLKKALKSTFYEMPLFNMLGFDYFEKIDGHDFKELIKYLEYAKNNSSSVVLHVVTKKGKGYLPAENDETGNWHGVEPFDITTGKPKVSCDRVTYGEVLGEALINYVKEGKNKDLIRVITPAMALGSGLDKFSKKVPNKFLDVGLAEENATLMAGAMAHAGLVPILFVYATFLQRAYDELLHDIARTNEHVVICIDHCGIVSSDGDTHQGIFDLAYLDSIPGLTILSPKDANEAVAMLKYAIDEIEGPIVIRYPKGKILGKTNDITYLPVWNELTKGNKCVITYGILVNEVLDLINNNNLDVELINATSYNPLDEKKLLELASKYQEIIVYEEVIENGSLGNKIMRYFNKHNMKTRVKNICLPNSYLEVGSRNELMNEYKISLDDLMKELGE